MATTIKLKNGSGAPTAGQLVQGEPALDLTNKRLYTEDSGGTVIEVGTNPTSLTTGGVTTGTLDVGADLGLGSKLDVYSASYQTLAAFRSVPSDGINPYLAIKSDAGGITLEQNGSSYKDITLMTGAVDRLNVAANGDISFFEDTGTTAKFFWDASLTSLKLTGAEASRSTGTYALEVDNSAHVSNMDVAGAFAVKGFYGTSLTVSGLGDVRFYDDANNAKFFWDASAESLGIGTSSPASSLHVLTAGDTVAKITSGDGFGAFLDLGDASDTDGGRIGYDSGSNLLFNTASTERLRIDSSGNVGIGTSSPSAKLEVLATAPTYTNNGTVFWGGTTNNDSHNGIMLSSYGDALGGSVGSNLNYNNGTLTQTNTNRSSGEIQFSNTTTVGLTSEIKFGGYSKGTTAYTERARIDSSGNLLVGTTDAAVGVGNTNTGSAFGGSTGYGCFSRTGAAAQATLYVNKNTNDGTLVAFNKDGTTVGSIGSISGPWLYIATSTGAGGGVYIADTEFAPSTSTGGVKDNAMTCGSAVRRWSTVYAGTGSINTSDEREKTPLEDLDATELAVAKELKAAIKKFKFKDAVEAKGEAARLHVGVGAQTVKAIFESHGLVAEDYAILCYDEWDAEFDEDGNETRPAGSRYGVRYEELLAFIIAAI